MMEDRGQFVGARAPAVARKSGDTEKRQKEKLKGAYTEWFGISPELISVLDTIYNMAYWPPKPPTETVKLQTGPVTHVP